MTTLRSSGSCSSSPPPPPPLSAASLPERARSHFTWTVDQDWTVELFVAPYRRLRLLPPSSPPSSAPAASSSLHHSSPSDNKWLLSRLPSALTDLLDREALRTARAVCGEWRRTVDLRFRDELFRIDPLALFPVELSFLILTKLPPTDLANVLFVSRLWHRLAEDVRHRCFASLRSSSSTLSSSLMIFADDRYSNHDDNKAAKRRPARVGGWCGTRPAGVITVGVGHTGGLVASRFWDRITREHGLNCKGEAERFFLANHGDKIDIHFDETFGRRYVPRAVFLGENETLDMLRENHNPFRPESWVYKQKASSSFVAPWEARNICVDEAMDSIRQEMERCDVVDGLQVIYHIGDQEELNLANSLIWKLRMEYPAHLLACYCYYSQSSITSPYNAILATTQLKENTDLVLLFDESSIDRVLSPHVRLEQTRLDTIARVVTNFSSCWRFADPLDKDRAGSISLDLRKLARHVVSIPTLHFLSSSVAPVFGTALGISSIFSLILLFRFCIVFLFCPFSYSGNSCIDQRIRDVFDPRNLLCGSTPESNRHYHHLEAVPIFTGRTLSPADKHHLQRRLHQILFRSSSCAPSVSQCSLDYTLSFPSWQQEQVKDFAENKGHEARTEPFFLATNIKRVPHKYDSATLIVNSPTALSTTLHEWLRNFDLLWRRRAFVHWYADDGMDEMEFTEARENVNLLLQTAEDVQPQ
ncbi:Tubulin beta chain [Balamuthia mandrillaris]